MKEYKILHLFAGIGGGSLGFQQAVGEWKGLKGQFRTLAGIDVDPKACEDYEYITGGKAVCMDLFERRDKSYLTPSRACSRVTDTLRTIGTMIVGRSAA